MSSKSTISRRKFLTYSGGAAGMLAVGGCRTPSPGHNPQAVSQTNGTRDRIRDIQFASIQDDYICTLVQVTTEQGVTGLGEMRPKFKPQWIESTVANYREMLIGKDPMQVDFLTRNLMAGVGGKKKKMQLGVISGIETALWDIMGKHLNTPVYTLLGGKHRDRILVYYDLAPADTPATTELALWAACGVQARKAGFHAVKMDVYRGGGTLEDWINITLAVREAIGPDMKFAVDFHWRLTPEQTDRYIEQTRSADLWYVEDPMNYRKYLNHYQTLTDRNDPPILALENVLDRKDFHRYISQEFCNIASPDAQYIGGIQEMKRIADIAELYGISTLPHNMSSPVGTIAQAHACATIPHFIALENACAEGIIRQPAPLYVDGHIQLSDAPGFGLELDEAYCRSHLVSGSTYFGK